MGGGGDTDGSEGGGQGHIYVLKPPVASNLRVVASDALCPCVMDGMVMQMDNSSSVRGEYMSNDHIDSIFGSFNPDSELGSSAPKASTPHLSGNVV